MNDEILQALNNAQLDFMACGTGVCRINGAGTVTHIPIQEWTNIGGEVEVMVSGGEKPGEGNGNLE
jgi:hypothetical protein